jgi:hypothetical protein
MNTSPDGVLRLSIDELLSTPIRHLISGLDEDASTSLDACGKVAAISGYTEWVSSTNPAITIGWDWYVKPTIEYPFWIRVGLPRSNIMLVDEAGQDTGWEKSLNILATVVDALPWREQIPDAVAARYA